MSKYDFRKIEKKWQRVWSRNKYKVWAAEDRSSKKKFYDLVMFPYPSGEGLHVGHVEGYTAADIVARFRRMNGENVLHPMGWDAFGLPAENYAIKTKTHPSKVVAKNVANFKKQLQSLGLSYDWSREINTTDPEYYKWTQWIFLQLFKKGLAYEAEVAVNWCPKDKTVIANEEVVEGCCERCGTKVERKKLKQWILKITAYADRLLKDLDELNWPEKVKEMQRNWIGRSEGSNIEFRIKSNELRIKVFTTRADTLFGASYVVLAPEHELVEKLKPQIKNREEVIKYVERTKNRSDRDRQENKEKTGVELKGVKAVNPVNNEELPVWVADYVLAHYGTGAVMAVPAHDQRDFEFAQKFNLPTTIVVCPHYPEKTCPVLDRAYEDEGHLVASGQFDGLPSAKAKEEIVKWLSQKGLAEKKISYKLRDWIFSRQRYWGEPIPIIKCEKCGNQPVPEEDLPVELPNVKNYEPTGEAESPLAGIAKWVNVKCPKCDGLAKRETNTMPQWAGSCWYYLRYLDPANRQSLVANSKEKYWMPVDLYVGGVEHAVLHLLYARFWHKFLYDIGMVGTKEPFQKLVNQGLILGPDNQKMSKSRGNVINPDDLVKEFGADSLRLYEMFMGPLEDAKPWQTEGIIGVHRFLNRMHAICSKLEVRNIRDDNSNKQSDRTLNAEHLLHQTIKKVTEDIQNFRFNTAISAMMILLNELEKNPPLEISNWKLVTKLLFPFAPHLAQECWEISGNKGLLDYEEWPKWDEKLIQEEEFDLVVQINGKTRAVIKAQKGIAQAEAEKTALADPSVQKWLEGKTPKKVVFVKDRLISFVI